MYMYIFYVRMYMYIQSYPFAPLLKRCIYVYIYIYVCTNFASIYIYIYILHVSYEEEDTCVI
jgi:hypothetical protein